MKPRNTEAGREHPQVCGFYEVRNHLGVERGDASCVQRAGGAGRRVHSNVDLGGGGGALAARVLFPMDCLDFPEASSLELQNLEWSGFSPVMHSIPGSPLKYDIQSYRRSPLQILIQFKCKI